MDVIEHPAIKGSWRSHDGSVTLYLGDCLEILPLLPSPDCVITDPPYGETSLAWDDAVSGWQTAIPGNCLWCFGSMRFFLTHVAAFAGWSFAQDIIWHKHNGSIFHADRFRRVHEHALHFYRGEWADVYKSPVYTNDATKRTMRRKNRPTHSGDIGAASYASSDGGPRLMRSVLDVRSCHGYAEHPTQKPLGIIEPLVTYSCPPSGTVLDPFMGSGTTGVACVKTGRNFVGIEINPGYFEIAVKRIDAECRQGKLF